jgi:hypothetical protein
MTVTALALLIGLFPGAGSEPPATRLRPVGRLAHPAIREASGIVASRRYRGIFWVHNDSGNAPNIFAVRRDGTLVREFTVGVPNVDWEDIATDSQGRLYLGEIGNNDGRLPLRAVYRIDEPDPFGPPEKAGEPVQALPLRAATYYRFPPGRRFDAEGLVIDGDRALIVAKTFDRRAAEVYAVPLEPPAPLLKPAMPAKVGTLPGFVDPVTGASLSVKGLLAVCSYGSVGVFERDPSGRWERVSIRTFEVEDEIEAVAWDGDDLILAGEGRGVYRMTEAEWRGAAGRQGPGHGR